MENLIVIYEIAYKLKHIRFNEECTAMYINKGLIDNVNNKNAEIDNPVDERISAPTYKQVFEWIKKEYNVTIDIIPIDDGMKNITYKVNFIVKSSKESHIKECVDNHGLIMYFNNLNSAKLMSLIRILDTISYFNTLHI